MLGNQVIGEIVKLIQEIKIENNIENEIIQDDVFSIFRLVII